VLQLGELQVEHLSESLFVMDLPSTVALKIDMTFDILSPPHFSQACRESLFSRSRNSVICPQSPHSYS
jgi:hypothetical protein